MSVCNQFGYYGISGFAKGGGCGGGKTESICHFCGFPCFTVFFFLGGGGPNINKKVD